MTQPVLPAGWRLRTFDRIDSTNDEAKRLAAAGEPGGLVLLAREQTGGHGRRGRSWISPPGNLYFSLLLHPPCAAREAAQLSFVTAVAMADALQPVPVTCKWPNDILLGGRKLGGILIEASGGGASVDWVVVGLGINLASHPEGVEWPATSLAAAGITVEPGPMAEQVARALAARIALWQREGFAPIRQAWLARAQGLGETVTVRLDRESFSGRFTGLDEDGALLLEQPGRPTRRVTAGDVFLG